MKQLNQLKCEHELSCATFELEIAAYQLIHCLVLGRILSYEVVTLSYDAIDIRFRHLDVCKSYSILSWNNEECSSKNRTNRDEFYNSNNISRDSINTHDSSLSSDSVLDIVNQIPQLTRHMNINNIMLTPSKLLDKSINYLPETMLLLDKCMTIF